MLPYAFTSKVCGQGDDGGVPLEVLGNRACTLQDGRVLLGVSNYCSGNAEVHSHCVYCHPKLVQFLKESCQKGIIKQKL